MKRNYRILLIINIFSSIYLNNIQNISLSVYFNNYVNNTFNVSLLNKDQAEIKNSQAKLVYITDFYNKDKPIIDTYTKYFNRIWIFYISNETEIKEVLKEQFESPIIITGIVIPKYLNYQISDIDNDNKEIPIIEIDDEYNDTMIQYDVRIDKRNTFFVIKQIFNLVLPMYYIIAFSISVLLSAIGLSLFWTILEKRVGPNYIFSYHDKIKYIFCAHIFLALTLIFKTISIMRSEGTELTETVEITLTLFYSFFKSILWFLIYLMGFGWYIVFQNILLNDQKKLMKLLIFIVICSWLDYILEKYLPKLWVFHLSEIKNIFLYSFLTYIIVKKINKNKSLLFRKYNSALVLLPNYAEGIKVKIKLLSSLKFGVLSYLPLFFLVLLIHKIFLYDYDSSLLLIYNYLIPDFILEFIFIIIMRPKIVPDFYDEDIGDMFNENGGEIFKCVLPSFDDRFDDKEKIDNSNCIKKIDDRDEIPIIVIGPDNYNNSPHNSDNSEIIESDINKYFSTIHVGYYNLKK